MNAKFDEMRNTTDRLGTTTLKNHSVPFIGSITRRNGIYIECFVESFRAKSQTAMRMGKLQKTHTDNQLIYLTNNEIAETHIFFEKKS